MPYEKDFGKPTRLQKRQFGLYLSKEQEFRKLFRLTTAHLQHSELTLPELFKLSVLNQQTDDHMETSGSNITNEPRNLRAGD